jgi:hypothetical protein
MATAFICLFSATCGVCCAIMIVFVAVLVRPELKPDAAGLSLGDFVRRRHALPGSRVAFSPVTVGALHGRTKGSHFAILPAVQYAGGISHGDIARDRTHSNRTL